MGGSTFLILVRTYQYCSAVLISGVFVSVFESKYWSGSCSGSHGYIIRRLTHYLSTGIVQLHYYEHCRYDIRYPILLLSQFNPCLTNAHGFESHCYTPRLLHFVNQARYSEANCFKFIKHPFGCFINSLLLNLYSDVSFFRIGVR